MDAAERPALSERVARVEGFTGRVRGHDLVLGVHEVQPGRVELHVAEDDDLQMRLEDVGEERLVHPRAADGAARVAEDDVKDPEAAAACDGEVG